jgi:hypothetical protein
LVVEGWIICADVISRKELSYQKLSYLCARATVDGSLVWRCPNVIQALATQSNSQ